MKKHIFNLIILSALLLFSLASCKKGPGEGGKATIHGKVIDNSYSYSRTLAHFVYQATYEGQGENVYIVYGNDITYDNNIKTNYDGTFEFTFLRPGDYTIYVYQKDTLKYLNGAQNNLGTPISNKTSEIKMSVKISGKKDNIDAGIINIVK